MSANFKRLFPKGREELKIRISGSGGQGAILAATILGESATLQGLNAAGSSSYGSQARGGAASSDVIISFEPIDYPHVSRPDILVAMSQEAYEESSKHVVEDGLIIYDTFFVNKIKGNATGVQATQKLIDKFGTGRSANIFMLGILCKLIMQIDSECFLRAIEANIDKTFVKQAKEAFLMGMEVDLKW